MAKGRKTGGRDFTPGDPRAGRPALPGDVRAARKLTQGELERILNKFIWLDEDAFFAAIKDPACTMFEKMVGSIMAKAIQMGDPQRLELLVQRLIGKVIDKVEVTTPKPFVIEKLNGDQVIAGAKLEEET